MMGLIQGAFFGCIHKFFQLFFVIASVRYRQPKGFGLRFNRLFEPAVCKVTLGQSVEDIRGLFETDSFFCKIQGFSRILDQHAQ